MDKVCKPSMLPYMTLAAGGIGLGLRQWLFAAGVDEKGLLIPGHIAGVLSYGLTAVFFLWLIATVRRANGKDLGKPVAIPAALGALVGAIAIGESGVREYVAADSVMGMVALVCCLLGGIALLCQALCLITGRTPGAYIRLATVIPFIFLLISHYRIWSKEPQVQAYFYPFMAGVFLLLYAFFKARFFLEGKGYRQYLYAGQSALFLSCLSVQGSLSRFYIAMAVWVATDFFRTKEEGL